MGEKGIATIKNCSQKIWNGYLQILIEVFNVRIGLVYQKIRLRKYYIKYFSFQGGDFPPIAVCKTRL